MRAALDALLTCRRAAEEEDPSFRSPVLSSGDEYRPPPTEDDPSSEEVAGLVGSSPSASPRTVPATPTRDNIIGVILTLEDDQDQEASRPTEDSSTRQGSWEAVAGFPGFLQRVGHPPVLSVKQETLSPDEPSEEAALAGSSDGPSGAESPAGHGAGVGVDQLPAGVPSRRIAPEYLGPVEGYREALERTSVTGGSTSYSDGSSWFSSPDLLLPLEEVDPPSPWSDEVTLSGSEPVSTQDSWSRSSGEYHRPAPSSSSSSFQSSEREGTMEEEVEEGEWEEEEEGTDSFDLDSENTWSDEPSAY